MAKSELQKTVVSILKKWMFENDFSFLSSSYISTQEYDKKKKIKWILNEHTFLVSQTCHADQSIFSILIPKSC